MPAFAADLPPLDTYAHVCSVAAGALQPRGFDPGRTVRPAHVAAFRSARPASVVRRVTNTTPDLSITRANATSVVSAAVDDLERYSRFLSGWDGYDGEPIAPVAIRMAQVILNALRSGGAMSILTDIIPGPASDGSLDLELRATQRRLTITIYPGTEPDSVELRTFRSSGAEVEEKHDVEQDALVADLRWVLS